MAHSHQGHDVGTLTDRILKACVEVHKVLGPGFREIVYQRALALELEAEGLGFSREEKVPIYYKGKQIDTRRADFVVGDCMVETKAKDTLEPVDHVQALSYLKASRFKLGLLVNFGGMKIEVKRLVN